MRKRDQESAETPPGTSISNHSAAVAKGRIRGKINEGAPIEECRLRQDGPLPVPVIIEPGRIHFPTEAAQFPRRFISPSQDKF
ncbi:hypothetical protein [Mesorhizobium sp. DCY119]|uniref:hypothetical protein n=1 Tax=Mesorhizobium sp. DCY119 TaxID=2108445 RepID=UPI0013C430D5|nr:hypothetical protein [Mesorhizobium sp. DCY119]